MLPTAATGHSGLNVSSIELPWKCYLCVLTAVPQL